MKLVEILARNWETWPEDTISVTQEITGRIFLEHSDYVTANGVKYVAEDRRCAIVTRAQWEAERARIFGTQCNAAATGDIDAYERNQADQEVWDKVAVSCYVARLSHAYQHANTSTTARSFAFEGAAAEADAFMAERAKRMEKTK